jgi:cell division septum initiation protein DivIVA
MLDTQERKAASPNGNGRQGANAPESVEALEEALATARLRLQERLAGEIDEQRRELERLQAEYQKLHKESDAMVAQANETATRVLREASTASDQVLGEANDAAERTTREAMEAAERTMREASDAAELKLHEAAGASERMLREANENARATLSQAHEIANTLLTRLRDEAGSFMSVAADEVERVEKAIGATGSAKGGKLAAAPPTFERESGPAERSREVGLAIWAAKGGRHV